MSSLTVATFINQPDGSGVAGSVGSKWMRMWMDAGSGVHWNRMSGATTLRNKSFCGRARDEGRITWRMRNAILGQGSTKKIPAPENRSGMINCLKFATLIAIQFQIFSSSSCVCVCFFYFFFFFFLRKFATHFRWTTNFGQLLCGPKMERNAPSQRKLISD